MIRVSMYNRNSEFILHEKDIRFRNAGNYVEMGLEFMLKGLTECNTSSKGCFEPEKDAQVIGV